MSLAILIPYFKIEFLKKTLKSLSDQTDKRFKVYIGNDNSPSNPEILLSECNFNYTYKKFDKNLGGISLVQQWKRCLEMVEYEEWVMILGDDDVLGENVVAEFYNNIEKVEKQNINVIRYATYKIDDEDDITSTLYTHPVVEGSTDFIFRKSRSSLSEYIFKKNQINNIKFKELPLAWYSDVLAVLEFSNFKNVYSINEAKIFVRVSSISISGQQNNQEEKNKARFKYYYYLLSTKNHFFSTDQKINLLKMLEKTYLNDKKKIGRFIKIIYLHILIFNIRHSLSFFTDVIKLTFRL
jgi:hypothetical protein